MRSKILRNLVMVATVVSVQACASSGVRKPASTDADTREKLLNTYVNYGFPELEKYLEKSHADINYDGDLSAGVTTFGGDSSSNMSSEAFIGVFKNDPDAAACLGKASQALLRVFRNEKYNEYLSSLLSSSNDTYVNLWVREKTYVSPAYPHGDKNPEFSIVISDRSGLRLNAIWDKSSGCQFVSSTQIERIIDRHR